MPRLLGMSLITDLRAAGAALTGDDIPASTELHQIVGAIVKTLEHAGVTVAEDLLPKPVDDAVTPAVTAAEPAATAAATAAEPAATAAATDALAGLVARVESALAELEQKTSPAEPASVPPETQP